MEKRAGRVEGPRTAAAFGEDPNSNHPAADVFSSQLSLRPKTGSAVTVLHPYNQFHGVEALHYEPEGRGLDSR